MEKETALKIKHEGIVFNIQSYSIHDGPGIRTVVFLKGCPLSCLWCSNPESQSTNPELGVSAILCQRCGFCVDRCSANAISITENGSVFTDWALCIRCGKCEKFCPNNARKLYGTVYSLDQLISRIEKDRPFFTRSGGGVTFSGGEPTIQYGFLLGALQACKEHFMHTAIETCGYIPDREKLHNLMPFTNLFLYDIKCMDSEKHERFTGVSNEVILDNARRIVEAGRDLVIRVPLIPGFNDTENDLRRIAEFVISLTSVRHVNLLPYHELGKSKYRMIDREYTMDEGEEISDTRIAEFQSIIQSFDLVCDID